MAFFSFDLFELFDEVLLEAIKVSDGALNLCLVLVDILRGFSLKIGNLLFHLCDCLALGFRQAKTVALLV